jgi:hypothetical protein
LDRSTTASSSSSPRDRYELLREIIELRRTGVLTEVEFEKEKARILEQP